MVSKLLDLMVQQGIIQDSRRDAAGTSAATKRSQRQHIVDELVTTERTYVQHLELLQAFKQLCESKGVITGDVSHRIFHNLDSLLNFQRRFLIRVEQINAQPEMEQNWGKIFITFSDSFIVYEPYIANQKLSEETVAKEYNKLKEAGGSTEMRQMVESPASLGGFLMKPFQRLSKYPLLLKVGPSRPRPSPKPANANATRNCTNMEISMRSARRTWSWVRTVPPMCSCEPTRQSKMKTS